MLDAYLGSTCVTTCKTELVKPDSLYGFSLLITVTFPMSIVNSIAEQTRDVIMSGNKLWIVKYFGRRYEYSNKSKGIQTQNAGNSVSLIN